MDNFSGYVVHSVQLGTSISEYERVETSVALQVVYSLVMWIGSLKVSPARIFIALSWSKLGWRRLALSSLGRFVVSSVALPETCKRQPSKVSETYLEGKNAVPLAAEHSTSDCKRNQRKGSRGRKDGSTKKEAKLEVSRVCARNWWEGCFNRDCWMIKRGNWHSLDAEERWYFHAEASYWGQSDVLHLRGRSEKTYWRVGCA